MNKTPSRTTLFKFNILGLGYGKIKRPSRLRRNKVPPNIKHCEHGNIRGKIRITMMRSRFNKIHTFGPKSIRAP